MSTDGIKKRLDEISAGIEERIAGTPADILGLQPATIYYATEAEKTEIHTLKQQLPSYAEEKAAAKERIQARIAARRARRMKV